MKNRIVCGVIFLSLSFWEVSYADTVSNLLINEIQVSNIDRYIDPSYNYGGWIELYNAGDQTVSLAGMMLRHTDSDNIVETYTLTSDHGSVASKGYTCLWFDHNSQDGYYGTKAKTQIRYKLDADGGKIELLSSDGSVLSSVSYPAAVARCSYLRTKDGGNNWSFTSKPTPNGTNNTTTFATKRLEAPVIDTESKVFSSAFSFKVTIPEHTQLYYTIDGSTPDPEKSATSQDGEFKVDETIIYRFLLVRDGYLNSRVVTRSFIKNTENYYLPIISVSTNPDNLYDNTIGVYVRGTNGRIANNSGTKANQNMDWERPVNFEYLVPDQNHNYATQINQEVSFQVSGGYSRFKGGNDEWDTRSSFKLKAGKEYEGVNELSYPFFSSKPHIKLKAVLVRNGGSDQSARIRDAGVQEIIRTSGFYIDCQACQSAHVFFNGKYLGMLNLREESNKRFAYSNYGIESEEIDQWENDITIKEGDSKQVNNWLGLANKLANNPTDKTIWQKIENQIDVDEYCNYMAVQSYIGNRDWLLSSGSFKNIKGFCPRSDNGKIHFVLFDTDGNFGDTDLITQILNNGTGKTAKAFINMLKYKPFSKRFVDTYCIIDGSIFEPARCKAVLDSMTEVMDDAMKMEGGSTETLAKVIYARIADYTTRRPALKASLKSAFDLSDEYNVNLTSNTIGHRFLFNGQEIPTGKFDGYMFAPITLTAIAPAGYLFESWKVNGKVFSTDSILSLSDKKDAGTYTISAQFRAIKSMSPIRINEVSAGNDIYINDYGKKDDFIELYNTTAKDINLDGCYLSDKRDDPLKYRIASGDKDVNTIIPAYGYKIIWCDKKDPISQLHANFKLENQDDAYISITAADGSWSDHLKYKAQDRWYTFGRYPDGSNQVALFRRPTIETPNRICYDTELFADSSNEDSEINSYQLTISEAQWATLCLPFSFTIPQGLTVYTITGTASDGSTLILSPVSSPHDHEPYLVHGPVGKYALSGTFVKGDDTKSDYLVNGLLTGVLAATKAPSDSYVLQMQNNLVGFYRVNQDKEITVPAYQAYLSTNASRKTLIRITDGSTVVESVNHTVDDIQYFDMYGHPVETIQSSGLYLLNSSGQCRKILIR